jgi:hypothetical protein
LNFAPEAASFETLLKKIENNDVAHLVVSFSLGNRNEQIESLISSLRINTSIRFIGKFYPVFCLIPDLSFLGEISAQQFSLLLSSFGSPQLNEVMFSEGAVLDGEFDIVQNLPISLRLAQFSGKHHKDISARHF